MGVKSFLFGGGSSGPKFKVGGMEDTSMSAANYQMGNQLGGKITGYYDKDRFGKRMPIWDFSSAGKPATVSSATAPYSQGFGSMDKAISEFSKGGTPFTQTYGPSAYSKFNFDFADPDKIDDITSARYGLMSSDLTRAQKGEQERAAEAMGARAAMRPGLMLKSQQSGSRDLLEQLAKSRTGMESDALQQKLAAEQAQQMAQAGEQQFKFGADTGEAYKSFQSKSDLERANEDNRFRFANALADQAKNKILTQQGITDAERNRQLQQLQISMNAFLAQQSNRRGSQKQNTGGGLLGQAMTAGSKMASGFMGGGG